MVASDPAASRKRKTAPSVNECASKKPKYVKELANSGRAANVAGARKVDDIADAKIKAKIENAQAKVKARLEEREVKGSTKRKSEETLPRPTENQQGNAAPPF
ncbi:hypothetical protein MMC22_010980 [Lobaria immixta]|nr:hypothetical protein [Lobaria immixta]